MALFKTWQDRQDAIVAAAKSVASCMNHFEIGAWLDTQYVIAEQAYKDSVALEDACIAMDEACKSMDSVESTTYAYAPSLVALSQDLLEGMRNAHKALEVKYAAADAKSSALTETVDVLEEAYNIAE